MGSLIIGGGGGTDGTLEMPTLWSGAIAKLFGSVGSLKFYAALSFQHTGGGGHCGPD